MPGVERRDVLRLAAFAIAAAAGTAASDVEPPRPAAGGGGAGNETDADVQTPVPGGEHLGGTVGEGYQVDVATTLGAIPEPDETPQLIYVTGSTHEKGAYVNLGADDDVPLTLRLDGFEIVIADSLAAVDERQQPLQYILVRSGSEKGEYVAASESAVDVLDGAVDLAVAAALADVPAFDRFPGVGLVTGSGAAKGTYTDTEA